MAGSGIRGQFEEKFKALIRDIEEEASAVTFNYIEEESYLHVTEGGECYMFHRRSS